MKKILLALLLISSYSYADRYDNCNAQVYRDGKPVDKEFQVDVLDYKNRFELRQGSTFIDASPVLESTNRYNGNMKRITNEAEWRIDDNGTKTYSIEYYATKSTLKVTCK
ncbi:hypothetical protein MM416_004222 [Salmonella enterica]|nr:hypothetical protein [Salmonella enterica]